jgi:hypothetical protein
MSPILRRFKRASSDEDDRHILMSMSPVTDDCTLDDAETLIVREEDLSPGAFVKLFKSDPTSIKGARINAPKIGHGGFGTIHVEYAMPRVRQFFKLKTKKG